MALVLLSTGPTSPHPDMVQKRQGLSAQQPTPAQVLSNLQTSQATPNVQVNIPRPELLTPTDLSKLSKTLEQALKLEIEEDKKIEAAQGAEYARTLQPEQRASIGLINQAKAVEQGLLPAERTTTFWNALQGTAAELNVVDYFLPELNKREEELINASAEERSALFSQIWADTVGKGGDGSNYYYSQAAAGMYSEIAGRKLAEFDKKANDRLVAKANQDAIHLGAEVINKRVIPVLGTGQDPKPEWEMVAERVNLSWKGTQFGQNSQQDALLTMLKSISAQLTRTDLSVEEQRRGAERAISLLQSAEDDALIGSGQAGGPGFRQAFPDGSEQQLELSREIERLIAKERRVGQEILSKTKEKRELVDEIVLDNEFQAALLEVYNTRGFSAFDDLQDKLREAAGTRDMDELRENLDTVFDQYGLPKLDDADFRTITATDSLVTHFIREIGTSTELSYGAEAKDEDAAAFVSIEEALREGRITVALGLINELDNAQLKSRASALLKRTRRGESVMEYPSVKNWWDQSGNLTEAFAAELGNAVRSEYYRASEEILNQARIDFRQLWDGEDNLTIAAVGQNQGWKDLKSRTEQQLAELESQFRERKNEAGREAAEKVNDSRLFGGSDGAAYTVEDLMADLVTTGHYQGNDRYVLDLVKQIENGTESRILLARVETAMKSLLDNMIEQKKREGVLDEVTEEQLGRARAVISEELRADMEAFAKEELPNMDPDAFYQLGDRRNAYAQVVQDRLTRNRTLVRAFEAIQAPKPKEDEEKGTEQALLEIGGQGILTNDALGLAANVQQNWSKELKDAGGARFATEPTRDLLISGNVPNGIVAREAWDGMDRFGPQDSYDNLVNQFERLSKGESLALSYAPGVVGSRGTETLPNFFVPAGPARNPAEVAAEIDGLVEEDEFGQLVLPTPFNVAQLGDGFLPVNELLIPGSGSFRGLARDLELGDEVSTEFFLLGDGQETSLDDALSANFSAVPTPAASPWAYSDAVVIGGLVDNYFDDDDYTADAARRGLLTGVAYFTSGGISPDAVISGTARVSLGTQAEVLINVDGQDRQAVIDRLSGPYAALNRNINIDNPNVPSPTAGLTARRVLRSRHIDVGLKKAMPEYDPAKVRIGDPEFVLRFFAENVGSDGRFIEGSKGEQWLKASNKLGREQQPIPNTAEAVQALYVAQLSLSIPWTDDPDWTNKIQFEMDALREIQKRGRSAVR